MRLATLLLALLLAGCASSPETPAGGQAPAWQFTALDGSTHAQEAPEANATVLFFMATWCGSCRSKAPMLAEAQDELAGQGVRFLSVDFDPTESADAIEAWQARYGHDWPHGIDAGLSVQRALGVRTQSSVVVLAADGAIVEHFGYGQVSAAGLREAVSRALAQ